MTSLDLEQGLWDGVMVVMEVMVMVMVMVVMVMVMVLVVVVVTVVVVMVVVRTNFECLLCSQVHGRTWNPWEGAQRGPEAQAVCFSVIFQCSTASCAFQEAEAQLTVVLFQGGSVGYSPLLSGHSGSQRRPGPLL